MRMKEKLVITPTRVIVEFPFNPHDRDVVTIEVESADGATVVYKIKGRLKRSERPTHEYRQRQCA